MQITPGQIVRLRAVDDRADPSPSQRVTVIDYDPPTGIAHGVILEADATDDDYGMVEFMLTDVVTEES